jgi:branched-chain amino acid transport system substrate-binding protein
MRKFFGGIGIVGAFLFLFGSGVVLAADVVKIGVMGPTTGGAAIVGIDCLRGIQVAAKEVNDRGGVKVKGKSYKVELMDMDDGAVVANSVANARRLVALHKVSVIIGPPISSCTLAVLEFNDKKGTEFLNITMSMHPDIVKRGNKLIVRTNISTKDLGGQLVAELMKKKKPKNLAIVHHTDDWGTTWRDGLDESVKAMGGKVVAIEGIDERKQTDFYPQLTKIVGMNPDVIFLIAHDSVTAMMVKQAREIGYKGRLVFSEGFHEPGRNLVIDKIEGSITPAGPMDMLTPGAQRYINMFKKMFPNEIPQAYGALTFDQFRIIIHAMEKAQNITDPYAIRAAVPKVLPIPDYINLIKDCYETGQTPLIYLFGEIKNGKLIEVQPE